MTTATGLHGDLTVDAPGETARECEPKPSALRSLRGRATTARLENEVYFLGAHARSVIVDVNAGRVTFGAALYLIVIGLSGLAIGAIIRNTGGR